MGGISLSPLPDVSKPRNSHLLSFDCVVSLQPSIVLAAFAPVALVVLGRRLITAAAIFLIPILRFTVSFYCAAAFSG